MHELNNEQMLTSLNANIPSLLEFGREHGIDCQALEALIADVPATRQDKIRMLLNYDGACKVVRRIQAALESIHG